MSNDTFDYIIIGAGIVGMSLALRLRERHPASRIAILEKEDDVARHASGRNSGVLHAGVYYPADSLKAKFTLAGNRAMQDFCRRHHIYVNPCQKLIVARHAGELAGLNELHRRAQTNGVPVSLISAVQARELEPNVRTYQRALLSSHTACVDPRVVCLKLKEILLHKGIEFKFSHRVKLATNKQVVCVPGTYSYKFLINAAGLYADKIAQSMGLAQHYTMLPFKGIYLKYLGETGRVRTNIYPVPDLKNPFLGVHFTKTVHDEVKIGPTAIPAFWRENYKGLSGFKFGELVDILAQQTKLFFSNAFNFRSLALVEMKKYYKPFFIKASKQLVQNVGGEFSLVPAGIRAQLLNKENNKLEMDFIVQRTDNSLHVLNAVSPGFTCAFAMAEHLVDSYFI